MPKKQEKKFRISPGHHRRTSSVATKHGLMEWEDIEFDSERKNWGETSWRLLGKQTPVDQSKVQYKVKKEDIKYTPDKVLKEV